MKLYLLEQDFNIGYDTYDSCVVAAENEEEARRTHPRGPEKFRWNKDGILEEYNRFNETREIQDYDYEDWVGDRIDKVKVTYLGEYILDTQKGVICASFNAG